MKNNKTTTKASILLSAAIFAFFLVACEKNDTKEDATLVLNQNAQPAPRPISELVANPNDSQDESINNKLFGAAKELTLKIDKNEVSIDQGTETGLISSSLLKSYSPMPSYKNVDYGIGLDIINKGSCDYSLVPIVAIGTDICVDGEMDGSYIPAFKKNGEGTWEEIILNEKGAMESKNPVVVVNVEQKGELPNLKSQVVGFEQENNPVNALSSSNAAYRIKITEYKIDRAYDDDRNSEYHVAWVFCYIGMPGVEREHIRDINNNNEINVKITDSQFTFYYKSPEGVTGYYLQSDAQTYLAGATYEHDWYASLKSILVNGVQIIIRAKYETEYYTRFTFIVPQGSSSKTQTYTEKGYVVITTY